MALVCQTTKKKNKTISKTGKRSRMLIFPFPGDIVTSDKKVFPFAANRPCHRFTEVLEKYDEITPVVILSGPTSFAPIIHEAISIVKQEKGVRDREREERGERRREGTDEGRDDGRERRLIVLQYHILIIIADGQVTSETETKNAIVEASNYPISIVLVGVGGKWRRGRGREREGENEFLFVSSLFRWTLGHDA